MIETLESFFDLDSHVCTRYYSDASLLVHTILLLSTYPTSLYATILVPDATFLSQPQTSTLNHPPTV